MTSSPGTPSVTQSSVPPQAERRPTTRVHHGDSVVDEYEWLRDKEDPATLAYLEAENAYTEQQTAHLEPLRQRIFEEITARVQETDLSVPVRHGDWWYYTRVQEGQQYAIRCRCPIADPADWTPPVLDSQAPIDGEQILLDSNVEAEGHEFFSLGAFSLSDDDRYLAWSVDTTGDERYTIRVKDLRTGAIHDDVIEDASTGATWSADGDYLFYTVVDDAWRPHQVWRHHVGGGEEDVLVFAEPDERYFVGIGRSQSEKYLVISLASKITSESRILAADDPTGEFAVVLPRREGVEYGIEHVVLDGHDRFLLLHNDGVPNFELALIDPADPSDRTIVLAGDDTARLEDVDVFASFVAVSYRREALTRIGILPIEGDGFGSLHEIEFDEPLFACGVGANAEWDTPLLRIGYTSFVTPGSVYDYEVSTGRLLLRRQVPVLGGYDAADYRQERLWATADDGTQVPVSLVYRADVARDGTAPTLLYGYGSYEASMDPGFSVPRLSLLDRGFVYAVAHVRGGGEMGRHWYENGKLLAKRNTFTDFIACARQLVADGWTTPERLVAEGGSAGGLLMGAVANLAPEDFVGIIAEVPFVDALTSILDPSLPLTVIEWDEWGDPLHDPEVYEYMKSYSPYENIGPHSYPAICAVTSLNDTRVLYVEPAKWVAKLRSIAQTSRPVLLKTEMSAGHGGVSGRYAAWKERAWELAWIIDTAGAS
ncbi:S9 family peptidase [Aeromicrobium sp. YIM 150415]|uniref:S9 family peptidase n=1 Tax=Aeromicrobium sp. YIM 150415 TaxID=2803912 RepID=UPI0019664B8E|nr:S9 family peptidase [Aeromicrobium sp. YIM 150415]MBM9462675.1 S9 family peptidase [Aeromicrobium sp. YIM 150415]